MYTKRLLFLSVAFFIAINCLATSYLTIQNTIKIDSASVDSVKVGKELFVKNCGKCHKLKDPAKYTMQQWPKQVNRMQKRAKINDGQKALILRYLQTEAKR